MNEYLFVIAAQRKIHIKHKERGNTNTARALGEREPPPMRGAAPNPDPEIRSPDNFKNLMRTSLSRDRSPV